MTTLIVGGDGSVGHMKVGELVTALDDASATTIVGHDETKVTGVIPNSSLRLRRRIRSGDQCRQTVA